MFRKIFAPQPIFPRLFRTGLLVLFAAVLAGGCTPKPKPAVGQNGQIISVTDAAFGTGSTDTVRFGHLRPGEIAVKQLSVVNNTTKPVVILAIERTCGCLSAEYDNQPIMPGEARPLALTFDSRGEQGWQLKLLGIRLAGAQTPLRLYVEAEVE